MTDLELKEQLAEINRLKDIVLNALVGARAHPRELSLALLLICIEGHRMGSSMNDKEIRAQLRQMANWLMRSGTVIRKKDIH